MGNSGQRVTGRRVESDSGGGFWQRSMPIQNPAHGTAPPLWRVALEDPGRRIQACPREENGI